MSPDQCREARGLLRWSQGDLAEAADVPPWFVIAFEDGDSPALMAGHEANLREAFEAAGIKFDGDVVTLAPRGRGGVN